MKNLDFLLSLIALNTTLTTDNLAKVLSKDDPNPEDFLDAALKTSEDMTATISFFLEHQERLEAGENSYDDMLRKSYKMSQVNEVFMKIMRSATGLTDEHDHDCDTCPGKGKCPIEDQMRVLKMQKPTINSQILDAEIKQEFLNQITKLKQKKDEAV